MIAPGLDQVLCPPTPLALAGSGYLGLPLRVRDLLTLGRGARASRRRAFAPYRDLIHLETDPALRRRWCREALALLDAERAAGDGDGWWDSYLAAVLRASAPVPHALAPALSQSEWLEVLAVGQGDDPADEVYAAVDGPRPRDPDAPTWAKTYATLATRYAWLTPEAFGDLMLPQVRVLASGGECEPGAPGGDEHAALATFRRRAAFLGGD